MKRIAVIIAIILFLAPNVINADENFALSARWGGFPNIKFGVTGGSPEFEDTGFAFSFDIIGIALEHINTRIGFEFSPARFWTSRNLYSSDSKEMYSSDSKGWNFFNLNLYWNIIDFGILQFGPFNRINYMYLTDNGLDWSKITNTLGIRVGLVSKGDYTKIISEEDHMVVKYLGVEFGYRITDVRNDFYLGLDIDLIAIWEVIKFFGGK